MAEDAQPERPYRWTVHLALLLVPWAIYLVVLARQPIEQFEAWHNDIAWPAAHYLTVGLEGLLFPFLFYMAFSLLGGLILALVLLLLVSSLRRILLMNARFSEWSGPAAMILAPVLVFVFKVVPLTVTEIDPEARRLVVREFHVGLRYPTGSLEIAGDTIVALDLSSHARRGSGIYLELHAQVNGVGAVRLGRRACASPDAEVCLSSGEADLVELARLLGRADGTTMEVRPGHHVLRLGTP